MSCLRKLKSNFNLLSKYFLVLLIKSEHFECYPIQETTVFQIYILGSPENKTNKQTGKQTNKQQQPFPPKSHSLYLEILSLAQKMT